MSEIVYHDGSKTSLEFARLFKEARDWQARNAKTAQEQLVSRGVIAGHPDDGWVDRKANTLRLVYPEFQLREPQAGDLVALGSPSVGPGRIGNYRIVRVSEPKPSIFGGAALYPFEQVETLPQSDNIG